MVKILNLFERFPNYSKEEILEAVSKLRTEDQVLLKKAFKEDYSDTTDYHLLSSPEKSKVRKIISSKVSVFLDNPNNKERNSCNDILNYYRTYTKEEILDAINRLSKDQRDLIFQAYGEELNKTDIYRSLQENEKDKIRYILSKVLLKRLENKEINESNKGKQPKTLIERFPNKNKIELEYAICQLKENRREILKKAFGENYDTLDNYESLTKEERRSVQVAIVQLKEKIKAIEEKGIYGYFNHYPKEKLERIIGDSSIEEQNIIYSIFGENLEIYNNLQALSKDELEKLEGVLNRINNRILEVKEFHKKQIENRSTRKGKIPQTLREFFPGITIEELNDIISYLSIENQLLLKEAYGNDYDSIEGLSNLSKKEMNRIALIRKKIKNVILGKIQKDDLNREGRKGINAKTFIECFNSNSQEKIIEIVLSLSEQDQELLRKAYGEHFDQIDSFYTLDVLEKRRIQEIKHKVRKILSQNDSQNSNQKRVVKAKNIIEYFHNYSMDEVKKALSFLSNEEIQELQEAYGENLDSTDEFSELGMKEKRRIYVIRNKIKSILENNGIPEERRPRKRNIVKKKTNKPIQKKKKETTPMKQKKYIPISKQKEHKWIKSLKLSYYYDVDQEKGKEYLRYYFEVFPLRRKKYEEILSKIVELKMETEKNYIYYTHEENGLNNELNQSIELLKDFSHQLRMLEEKRKQLLEQYILDAKERRDRFLEYNQGLVTNIAKSKIFYAPLDDLISEGNIGMMKALEKFDVNSGNKFSTYATWVISSTINRYIQNGEKTIRIPVDKDNDMRKINIIMDQLTAELSRKPTIEEIVEASSYTEEQVVEILRYQEQLTKPASLDQKMLADSDLDLSSTLGKEDNSYEEIESKLFLEQFVKLINNISFTSKEKKVVIKRFGLDGNSPRTMQELSEELGISKERVRQLELKALKKIRSNMNSILFLQDSVEEDRKIIRKRM